MIPVKYAMHERGRGKDTMMEVFISEHVVFPNPNMKKLTVRYTEALSLLQSHIRDLYRL